MRTPVAVIVALIVVCLVTFPTRAEEGTRYFRGYATGVDGRPIGLGAVDETEIGRTLAYRFVAEAGGVLRVERLGRGTKLSSRLTFEGPRLVRVESFTSAGELSSVKKYTHDAAGRVVTETYEPLSGKSHQGYTRATRYDDAGRVARITTTSATGSVQEEVYEAGRLVGRRTIGRNGRVSSRHEYVYGPLFSQVWTEERLLDAQGIVVRTRENAVLHDVRAPARPPLRAERRAGDDAALRLVEVTHPAFSPANSLHVKDTTRLSVILNEGRPLRLELRESETDEVVRTMWRPHVGSKGHAHFRWEGAVETGAMAADGVYAYRIRTPVVRAWQVEFLKRGPVGQRLLDCTDKFVYVCDPESARVVVFDSAGEIARVVELAVDQTWGRRQTWPSALDVVADERLYVTYGGRLRVYGMDGALLNEVAPRLEGLPWASSFGVGPDGTVYCVVEHGHSRGVRRDKGAGGFSVLELDAQGRTVQVVADVPSMFPDGSPFVHDGVLYVNAHHFHQRDIQRVLLELDTATGRQRLVEQRATVTDAGLRTPVLLAVGGVDFYDVGGQHVLGLDCGSPQFALQGGRVYSLTDGASVLCCYETKSDAVLLEGELIVDNTSPAASITYPGPDGLIAGEPDVVEITGIATDTNFDKYEVFWRPASSRNWKWRLLKASDVPCDGATLAVWDTRTIRLANIKNRDIALRLVVTDAAGNTSEAGFFVRYDADNDGFSNEFESANRELDKNTRTKRRTACIVPDITLLLRREFPINGTCALSVQLVDETTQTVLEDGVLEFGVNVGTIQARAHVRSATRCAKANWQTPQSIEPAGVLTVTLPPQGVDNVWYTAEPFEIGLPLVVDTDFDGLTDEYEQSTDYGYGAKTSATNADTDGDGIDDLHDLSPTVAPTEGFARDYPVGALRFKQTYRVISIAGDGSTVTKNGIDVGRWPLMDKSITDESVKDYFNHEVFKVDAEDEFERSPLHVIEAERTATYDGEVAANLTYTAPAGIPKYKFKYMTKEYLYELSVANREVTRYPVGGVGKYGFIARDVSLSSSGGNTIVVQFRLGGANRWRDEDEAGSFTKMFMRYALYERGQVATAFPYYTGLAPMEWSGQKVFQCHLVLPDAVYEAMAEQGIGGEQTVVLSPVWVEHTGGPMACALHKNHPAIPVESDSCLLCGYRPVRDRFVPVYTGGITLTALAMRYDHYAYMAIGRVVARAGGPPIDAATDMAKLTAVFERFHPRGGNAGPPANGLVPVTVDGTLYQVLTVQHAGPGASASTATAELLAAHLPEADAVVLRAGSSWHLNQLVEELKGVVAAHERADEWAVVDTAPPADAAGPDTADEMDAAVEEQADSALDKLEAVGTRFKEVREVAEFVVDVSNMPVSFRADQLSSSLASPTVFGSAMSSLTQTSHNVAVTKLPNGQLEVALQRRAMFSAKRSGGQIVSTRYYVKTVRTEQVDDLADSKIAAEYGVVNKIPTGLIVGAKIGATLMTDGVELYKAVRHRDGLDIVYYGARGTGNVLAALGSASVKWKNTRLFKGVQLTKTARFNTVAAVIASIDVGYNLFKTATADTWLGRAAYSEKAAAAVVDGVIGCIEPYGAAATIGWQIGTFAGDKICDKFGWGESTELSRSVTSSIGSAVVFLFQEASLLGVPTAHANDAGMHVQNKLAEEVADYNAYLDERNLEAVRQVFIPPDKDD